MSIIDGNTTFKGTVAIQGQFYPPALSINGSHISQDANNRIPAETVEHQFSIPKVCFGPATNIAALTDFVWAANADGEIVGVDVFIEGAATGDRTATIDIKKSNGGGAYATVLSSPVTVNSSTAIRTAVPATIASAAYVAGNSFEVVVTVGGSTGTQPTGLLVMVYIREMPA
jgi:hypothetical protein